MIFVSFIFAVTKHKRLRVIFLPPFFFFSSFVLSSGWLASWVSRKVCLHQLQFIFAPSLSLKDISEKTRYGLTYQKNIFAHLRDTIFICRIKCFSVPSVPLLCHCTVHLSLLEVSVQNTAKGHLSSNVCFFFFL